MTLHVSGVDVVLDDAFLDSLQESALFFDLQEQLPAFLSQSVRQMLDIV